MALDDLVHDGQTETGALADRLGGEERIEDLRQHIVRNAMTRVFETDLDDIGLGHRTNRELALVIHRLRRIGDHVQEHLVDLRRHAFHLRHVAKFLHDLDAVAQLVTSDRQGTADAVVEVDGVHAIAVDAREPFQVQHQAAHLLQALGRVFQQLARLVQCRGARQFDACLLNRCLGTVDHRGVERQQQIDASHHLGDRGFVFADQVADHFDIALDEAERRVDLVCDASDHLAERCQLGRVDDLGLRSFTLLGFFLVLAEAGTQLAFA